MQKESLCYIKICETYNRVPIGSGEIISGKWKICIFNKLSKEHIDLKKLKELWATLQ
ncbi:hypothetical protein CM15mP43_06130 [bacterium]|nr:MAG: hypothetical protein CM15mP43_06130 [bacterium]